MTNRPSRAWVPDLFGEPSLPHAAGRGRRCHVPTSRLQGCVRALAASGQSIAAIATATGLSRSTLLRHYVVELGARKRGRPRHEPTSALRELVRSLAAEGRSLEAISRATNLAPQTVRRHYAGELAGAVGEGGGERSAASGP